MPRLTILVPVYNVECYLEKCLDSIIAQTYSDYEIICIDDGSTDNSGSILDKYSKADDRIRVIHKQNEGYGKTMNKGLDLAEGEYIGIVEPDDVILPDMYQKYIGDLEEFDVDYVRSDFFMTWHHADGTVANVYSRLSQKDELYDKVICPNTDLESYFFEKYTWNGVYRTRFLRENEIRYQETPGASYQDNGFWFQTMYKAKRMLFRKEAFYCYTRDNESASSYSPGKAYAFKHEYDYIRNYLLDNKETNSELYKICFHLRIKGYILTLLRISDELKKQFAKDIQDECKYYDGIGESEYKWLSERESYLLHNIIDDPEEFAERLIKRDQVLCEAIRKYDSIIVYGAGSRGAKLSWRIRQKLATGQSFDIAVTKLNDDNQYCLDLKTKELKDLTEKTDSGLVILSVKKNSNAYFEMKEYAQECGFKNVIEEMEL